MSNTPLRHFYIGDWKVDVTRGEIAKQGRYVHLEPKVMRVLAFMASHGNDVVLKNELINDIWRNESVGDASLTRCISTLRQALGDDARIPKYIKTVPKVGFRIVAKIGRFRYRNKLVATAIAATISAAFLVFVVSHLSMDKERPLSGLELQFESSDFETQAARILSYQLPKSIQLMNNGFLLYPYEASHTVVATVSRRREHQFLELTIQAIDTEDAPRTIELVLNETTLTELPNKIAQSLISEYELRESEHFEVPHTVHTTDRLNALDQYVHGYRRLEAESSKGYLEAIPFFREAIELDPKFGAAYAGLSLALMQAVELGNSDALVEAEAAAYSAMRHAPDDAISHFAIGEVLDYKDQTDDALLAFNAALSIDRSMWHASYGAARIHHRQHRLEQAEALYLQSLTYKEDHGPSMTGLGDINVLAGNVASAIRWFELALDRDPRYPLAISRLATAYLVSGDTESAISYCQKIADAYPRYDRCQYILTAAFLLSSQYESARVPLDQLFVDDPNNGYAVLGKAQIELANSNAQDAEVMLRQVASRAITAIERDPDEWRNYWLVAAAYSLLGDKDNAFLWLDRVRSTGRHFYLWDAMDPAFGPIRDDNRFDSYLASTRISAVVSE